nr:MAG: nucleocapsid protein [Wufeng shrew rhabdovirus 10]
MSDVHEREVREMEDEVARLQRQYSGVIAKMQSGQASARIMRTGGKLESIPFEKDTYDRIPVLSVPYVRSPKSAVVLFACELAMALIAQPSKDFTKVILTLGMQVFGIKNDDNRRFQLFSKQFGNSPVDSSDSNIIRVGSKLAALADWLKGTRPRLYKKDRKTGKKEGWDDVSDAELKELMKEVSDKSPEPVDTDREKLDLKVLMYYLTTGVSDANVNKVLTNVLSYLHETKSTSSTIQDWLSIARKEVDTDVPETVTTLIGQLLTMDEWDAAIWVEHTCQAYVRYGLKDETTVNVFLTKYRDVIARIMKLGNISVTEVTLPASIVNIIRTDFGSGSQNLSTAALFAARLMVATGVLMGSENRGAAKSVDPKAKQDNTKVTIPGGSDLAIGTARLYTYGLMLQYNGLKIYNMLARLGASLNMSPARLLSTSWCPDLGDSIEIILNALDEMDEKSALWPWCRAIDPRIESRLADKEHPKLTYFLVSMIAIREEQQDNEGIWNAVIPSLGGVEKEELSGLAKAVVEHITTMYKDTGGVVVGGVPYQKEHARRMEQGKRKPATTDGIDYDKYC